MGRMVPATEKIFTNRLLMRRVEESDLPTLFYWSSSSEAHGSYLTPEQSSMQELEQRFTSGLYWNSHEKLFMVETRDGAPLGTIHYWLPADRMHTAVIAVKIAEADQRNRGYGTEVQKSLVIFLFDKVKVLQAEMYTDIDNLAQQRCLRKLGFQLIETLTYDDRGIRRTGNLYRISRDQYQQQPIYHYHYE